MHNTQNRILYTDSVRRTYHTYIQIYRHGGRIRLTSVGLTQARPNNSTALKDNVA